MLLPRETSMQSRREDKGRQVVKRYLPFVSIRKNISTCWHLGNSFMRLNWNGISCTRKPGPMSGSATEMNRTTRKQASHKLLWEL